MQNGFKWEKKNMLEWSKSVSEHRFILIKKKVVPAWFKSFCVKQAPRQNSP